MRKPSPRAGSTSAPSVAPASPELSRRRFLLALGAGSAGAAAVAAAPALAQPVDTVAVAATATSGYRETEHVRDYYATTRI